MLKYQPRKFYAYAHSPPHSTGGVPPAAMADHMRDLFFDPTAPPDAVPPLPIPDFEAIDAAEIAACLPKFRGAASSGMSPLPSQVVKHLAGEALTPLARFLNLCIASGTPPK